MRIRIRNLYADPDPAAQINADPCGSGSETLRIRVRIADPCGSGSETLRIRVRIADPCGSGSETLRIRDRIADPDPYQNVTDPGIKLRYHTYCIHFDLV